LLLTAAAGYLHLISGLRTAVWEVGCPNNYQSTCGTNYCKTNSNELWK